MKTLKVILKEARIKAGLTQKEIADKFGYETPQFVSNWERGVSSPPLKTLKRLASIYKIDESILFDALLEHEVALVTQRLRKAFGKKAI